MSNFSNETLLGKNAIITGGAGLLGPRHGLALARAGANVTLVDISDENLIIAKKKILEIDKNFKIETYNLDITNLNEVEKFEKNFNSTQNYFSILINNAAVNPKMKNLDGKVSGRIEDYDLEEWNKEINVGLTGAFICSRVFGARMASNNNGVIINISSDLAVRAPDQRVYSPTESFDDIKSYKPIGYSVVKTALIGMTRYLAEYWGHKNVRVNALLPGGVFNNQPQELVENVKKRTLIGRWANIDEYEDAIVFLSSDSSAYMTGQAIVMDGGRSVI